MTCLRLSLASVEPQTLNNTDSGENTDSEEKPVAPCLASAASIDVGYPAFHFSSFPSHEFRVKDALPSRSGLTGQMMQDNV